MVNGECVIEVEGLHTRFGTHVVHEDINLCVHHGEVLALVGGSGSGKTALMRQMLGLDMPTGGTVRIFGESLYDHDRKELQAMR
ncbi:MAG: ATP-binding cassette domain-containing protein, partial [Nitrosospira sp.]|nr:ATP-binding cassette domain-containing protein [Nitrosospira sp.]